MASPFLDFLENYTPGGSSAIPSLLTALLVKKPKMNLDSMYPLYQSIASNVAGANQLAGAQAQNYESEYLPAAVNFNRNAQGVGGASDLAEAADRGAANFKSAFTAAREGATRDMAGVNPNSGGAQARLGAIDASYAPGVVDAMNKGRVARTQYGDTLRASALPFLATTPNYGASLSGAALGANMVNQANTMYRQQAGDTVKALKLPFDQQDEAKRAKTNQGNTSGPLDAVKAWLSTQGRAPSTLSAPAAPTADMRGYGFGPTGRGMFDDELSAAG